MTTSKGNYTRNRILEFISQFSLQHGYAPTREEIATGIGTSHSNVTHHLRSLEGLGQIKQQTHGRWAIAMAKDLHFTSEDPSTASPKRSVVPQSREHTLFLPVSSEHVVPLPWGTWMPSRQRKRTAQPLSKEHTRTGYDRE